MNFPIRWIRSGLGLLLAAQTAFLPALLTATPAAATEVIGVTVETLAKSSASWDGQALPAYPRGQPEITILRIRIPPGTRLPVHKHPVINAGVLTAGTLLVVSESGQSKRLNAGEGLIELVDAWHYGHNDGDDVAEILVIYAGGQGTPVTVPRPAR